MNAVSPAKWLDDCSSNYHWTIRNIINVPVGQTVKLFMIDKNALENSITNNVMDQAIKPSHFFRKNYYVNYTRTGNGLYGKFEWYWDEKKQKIDEKDEFDILIEKIEMWYPLKDEKICADAPVPYNGLHYSQLSTSTRIGWRGPMMLASDMNKCPDIILRTVEAN